MTNDKTNLYLGTPYGHEDASIRETRYKKALHYAVALMNTRRYNVFSPIIHSHNIAKKMTYSQEEDGNIWLPMDIAILENWAEVFAVGSMDGVANSKGLKIEIKKSVGLSLPILVISFDQNKELEIKHIMKGNYEG